VAARGGDAKEAREALAAICEAYWYPLYAFVWRKGNGLTPPSTSSRAFSQG